MCVFANLLYSLSLSFCTVIAACRLKKAAVVAETPAHKQGHNLLMKTELRRKRMKLGPTDLIVEESPMKFPQDSATPVALQTSQIMRHSSFYSEKPSRNVSKYTKLEERMTQKVLSPPLRKFDSTYVAGSWLTSPRRITPKALFGSLLSPSPSHKAGTKLPRKQDLKSPVRNVQCSASLDFTSPVKIVVGSSASSAIAASPLKPVASDLSQLGLDSPSRNTRSHTSSGKQGSQSNIQQHETLTSPSSLGRRYSRLMSPSSVDVTSPDFKRKSLAEKPSQSSVGRSFRSYDTADQIPVYSPKHVNSSSCVRRVHLTKRDVNAAEACSETLTLGSCGVMRSASDHGRKGQNEVPELDKRSPKKKCFLAKESLPFSSSFGSLSQSMQPLNQSLDKAESICGSDCCDTLMSAVGKLNPRLAETNMSCKRKKAGKDANKSFTRTRPNREIRLDSPLHTDEQHLSTTATDVYDNKLVQEVASVTTLSFGCDVETDDRARTEDVAHTEKLNSDVLRHLGSSGVESESSSNDVDLMIARKHLLDRKRSSGFQSLGHISETECCPSPVFPTIPSEAVVCPLDQTSQHTASNSVSTSPVFGKRQTRSFAGESPCLSLSGSGRKRTPVPSCIESFSPDVSQHSIAHLMTSPLLDGSDTCQKSSRNSSSTRRCLDKQMYQSDKHPSAGRHSSVKQRDEETE